MKSKKAEEYINTHPLFMAKTFAKNAVELAEQDAEEEIEALKAIAVEAFKEYMKQEHGGFLSSDLDNFIQKLNER
jgi:hypothetical protein